MPRSPSSATSSSRADTLWSIAAARYGDPREGVYELQQRNGLDGTTIVPGQVLMLP